MNKHGATITVENDDVGGSEKIHQGSVSWWPSQKESKLAVRAVCRQYPVLPLQALAIFKSLLTLGDYDDAILQSLIASLEDDLETIHTK